MISLTIFFLNDDLYDESSDEYRFYRLAGSPDLRLSKARSTLHGDDHHQPIELLMAIIITNPPPSFLLAETNIFIENSWANFFPMN